VNPLDKLREDVRYWRETLREGREMVRIAEGVLPGLEAHLRELESEPDGGAPGAAAQVAALPAVEEDQGALVEDLPSQEPPRDGGDPSFSGRCTEQVRQALAWEPDQSSVDLHENLAKYGSEFSRGAISYALRKLTSRGLVETIGKSGNLSFFRLTSAGRQAAMEA